MPDQNGAGPDHRGDGGEAQSSVLGWLATATDSRPHTKLQLVRADLIGADTAVAAGITATGHAPTLTLCRRLVEAGHDPSTPLEAYRGRPCVCGRARLAPGRVSQSEKAPTENPASRPTVPLQMAGRVAEVSRPRVQTLGRPLPMRGAPKTPRSGRPQARPVLIGPARQARCAVAASRKRRRASTMPAVTARAPKASTARSPALRAGDF